MERNFVLNVENESLGSLATPPAGLPYSQFGSPYVLGQFSEPIGFRINLMLNLGDLSDMFFRFGWLRFTTCERRGNI
jgi:hypothetical protein